jgi:hypothetical protein
MRYDKIKKTLHNAVRTENSMDHAGCNE